MLGSWDPISTLLRRAVQQEAIRVPAGEPPVLAADEGALAMAERRIVAATRSPADDWVGRALFGPAEELVLPALLSRRIGTQTLAATAAALAGLSGVLALAGWLWPALLAALLSGPTAAGAARLARVRDQHGRTLRLLQRLRIAGIGVALIGWAWTLYRLDHQWGWAVMATLVIGSLAGRLPATRPALWLASTDGLIWAMLPFAVAGTWGWGMAALAIYAVASFAAVQWRALREAA
jgi:hypothetical protein